MTVDAILPAGGRILGDVTREAGTSVKALLEFGRMTVLEQTLRTLRATGRTRRAVVVGPAEIAPYTKGLADAVLPETHSGPGNIMRGLEWLRARADGSDPERVLILTTDLPFLTPEAVRGFLDVCPAQLDLCVPIIERHEFELRFPRSAARYVRLRDGEWMIGCAFLINPAVVLRNISMVERVFAARRNKLSMARLLGPRFVWRFLTRCLTIGQIERKCLEIIGCSGGAIRGCAPELGFDIDYPQDYRYAVLRRQN
jgi:hypothetical protein